MPYQVMVVDDSAFMRKIVTDLIEQDSAFKVVGTAKNGVEAIELIEKLSPDVVTMDVEMPELNGLEALKVIMKKHPLTVIMLSGINEQGMQETIMALELGAFDFIRKPSVSTSSHDIEEVGRQLREQIRAAMLAIERKNARLLAMEKVNTDPVVSIDFTTTSVRTKKVQPSSVSPTVSPTRDVWPSNKQDQLTNPKTVKPKSSSRKAPNSEIAQPTAQSRSKVRETWESQTEPKTKEIRAKAADVVSKVRPSKEVIKPSSLGVPVDSGPVKDLLIDSGRASPPINKTFSELVAIGTSTGGPKALKAVLEKIPAHFPAPIVIVQHMPANFTKSLAERLNSLCLLHVVEAEEGMELLAGTAYIAPGGHHLNVVPTAGGKYKLTLSMQEPRSGHRPSVDVLYESLLPIHSLKRHLVLLTGMGSDGARAMKKLYDSGVTSTIAESEETCVVYGMPRSAVELQCVNHVLPLNEIGPKLVQIVK